MIIGGGRGGPTPNGENPHKFPFWLFDYLPYRRTIWGERYVCPDDIEDESHLKIESSSTRTIYHKDKKKQLQ